MSDVFISYHTDSASDLVTHIADMLENADISCWYAPRDVNTGAFAESVIQAIDECKVFLLILNEEANSSEHILSEVNAAFHRYNQHDGIHILPFRVDQCRLSDGMRYYIGSIQIFNGSKPPVETRIYELLNQISKLLGRSLIRPETAKSYNQESIKLPSIQWPQTYLPTEWFIALLIACGVACGTLLATLTGRLDKWTPQQIENEIIQDNVEFTQEEFELQDVERNPNREYNFP